MPKNPNDINDEDNDLLEQIIIDELAIFSFVALMVQSFMWSAWISQRLRPWLTVNIFKLDSADYDSTAGKFEELIWPELLVCFLISTFFNLIHAPGLRLYKFFRWGYRFCRWRLCGGKGINEGEKGDNKGELLQRDGLPYNAMMHDTSYALPVAVNGRQMRGGTRQGGMASMRVAAALGGMLTGMQPFDHHDG